jgi:hypothetical protein
MAPSGASFVSAVENNLFFGNGGGNDTKCRCVDANNGTVPCVNGCNGRGDDKSVTSDPRLAGQDVVIVNDGDAMGTSHVGTWTAASASDIHRYQGDAVVNAGGASDYFEFQAQSLPTSTATLIAIWWPRNFGENRASKVPVTVYDGTSTTPLASYVVDQASWDSSEWYYLGMHVFASGKSRVRIGSVPGKQVVADAVLWSKLGQGYKLEAGSPAINAGSAAVASVVTEDFFGNPVPGAGPPDIGIHER